jgi:hypothetical protein
MSIIRCFVVVFLVVLVACAGSGWERVRAEDTAVAYRRFVKDNPRSPHVAEANERIAVLALERDPSVEALDRFRREHPESQALPEVLARTEERVFDGARAQATVGAYDRFLETFPDGAFAARARGNRAFLAAGGFAGDAASIAAFVDAHPESDYAVEARRSLAVLDLRGARFGAVALQIDIAPGAGDSERLRAKFEERARDLYREAGVRLVDGAADATLRIRHAERSVAATQSGGVLTGSGRLAETEISIVASGRSEPEFVERFTWRVPDAGVRPNTSVLFTPTASVYWDRFYVPVASWQTAAARRGAWTANGALAAVGAAPGRAIALAPNGSFQDLDLSDPSRPRIVGSYARAGAPASFSGARIFGDRVVLFGEDGVEIVGRQGDGYRRLAGFDRGVVGAVAGLEEVDGRLLLAGTRGLVRVPIGGGGGGVERLVERPLRGVARSGETLFLLDEQWLYAGPLRDPRATSFFTAAEFGRGLDANLLRVRDSIGVVVGGAGVACFELVGQGAARTLSRLRTTAVGAIADAAVVGDRVFLIGERGLLVVDPRSGRIVDSVDVDARGSLGVAGGHLVSAGGAQLEVVDGTPWITRAAPASLAR